MALLNLLIYITILFNLSLKTIIEVIVKNIIADK